MYEIHEKEKVEFSVLISIYDKEKPECLAECLSSIAYQTVLPAEVIIVEDGYIGDDLKSVIDHYKNINNIHNERKRRIGEEEEVIDFDYIYFLS